MKIFLDTSSLFKLYHQEADSETIEAVIVQNYVQALVLAKTSDKLLLGFFDVEVLQT